MTEPIESVSCEATIWAIEVAEPIEPVSGAAAIWAIEVRPWELGFWGLVSIRPLRGLLNRR